MDSPRDRDDELEPDLLPLDDTALSELRRLEEMLRAELDASPAAESIAADAEIRTPPSANEPSDPLDEFFWRADETAPTLPDLVAASAAPQPEPVELRREWLTFRVGPEDYAVEIHHVREVLKPPPLTEVPRAPAHILGVVMVRGEVVAVLDPRVLLGLPPGEAGPRARILVCNAGDCGVLVDSVSHVVRLAPSSIEPRPPGVGGPSADYIVGIGRQRNRLFVLLDAVKLLAQALPTSPPGATP